MVLLTDERLRSWLDGNQPQRERLCIAVLALDRRYGAITPRRPRGGPDGGRDLQATFEGRHAVWGAVGFRNGANDSAADKRAVRKKFSDDVRLAKTQNPALTHFVFFTNVDLTPGEIDKLRAIARTEGVPSVEVFCRERIRIQLDSPDGLGLRYQYLEINMSPAEQAAFFSRFGDLLQSLVSTQYDAIDRKLARIEFHSECLRPARNIGLTLKLSKAYKSGDIPDLYFLLVIVAENRPEPPPTLCVAVRARAVDAASNSMESEVAIWAGKPPKLLLKGGVEEGFPATDVLWFGLELMGNSEFKTLAEFDMVWLHLYANQAAVDVVERIGLSVNGYVLAASEMRDLAFDPAPADDPWVTACIDPEGRPSLLENIDGPTSSPFIPPLAYTNFSSYRPVRVSASMEDAE